MTTVCMPVFSSFANQAFRAGLREAQDVLAECADVDLLHLSAAPGLSWKAGLLERFYYHDRTRTFARLNPGLKQVELEKEYDVFVAVLPDWRDFAYLNAIKGWRDRCTVSIVWIDELWARDVDDLKHWLYVLEQFDYIFTGINGTHHVLSQALGRECYELPGAVDALRFTPLPSCPDRVIDFYSVGRRMPALHDTLRRLSDEREFLYLFDTSKGGNGPVLDYREHRTMYANLAKRSRFFTVAPGKVDVPEQTGGQVDIGFRCFEGVAAGCVLIGARPDCELFDELFDWSESLIPIPSDVGSAQNVVESLLSDVDRVKAVSTRNAIEGLRRHDWIYRWKHIFQTSGLNVPPGILERERVLESLADKVSEN